MSSDIHFSLQYVCSVCVNYPWIKPQVVDSEVVVLRSAYGPIVTAIAPAENGRLRIDQGNDHHRRHIGSYLG